MTITNSASIPPQPRDDSAAEGGRWLWRGVRAMAPASAGLVPFAVSIGVAVAVSPLDDLVGLGTGPLLFGGSAQVATIELLGAHAGVLTVLATVAALTSRFAMYGAALAPALRDQPRWFRVLAPYFLVDPLMAAVSDVMSEPVAARARRTFYLGAAGTLYVSWLAGMAIGIAAVPHLDPVWSLDLAAPLCLVALLGRKLGRPQTTLPAVVATLVGAGGSIAGLPLGPVTLAATIAGAAAGALRRGGAR